MASFSAGDINATLTLDRAPFQRELEAATREGDKFDGKVFRAKFAADNTDFNRGQKEATARGKEFGDSKYTAKLAADRSQLARDVQAAKAELNGFDRTTSKGKVDIDDSPLKGTLKKSEAEAAKSGIEVANKFSAPLRSIQFAAIGAGITALVADFPVLLAGAGAIGAALVGAFKAPLGAIQQYTKAQTAVESGAANASQQVAQFQVAFAGLTPQAQAFVTQAIGLEKTMGDFGKTMQSSVLPGMTSLLYGMDTLIPSISKGSQAVGQALGQIGNNAGSLLRTAQFQDEVNTSMQNSVPIVSAAGNAIVALLQDSAHYAANSREQALGTADMVNELSTGLTRMFTNLLPYQAQVGSLFANLGGIVGDFLAEAGKLTGQIAGGLAPALGTLRVTLEQAYQAVSVLVSGAMPGLSTAFSGTATIVTALLNTLQPLMPILGSVTGAVIPFVESLKIINTVSMGNLSGQFKSLKKSMSEAEGARATLKAGMSGLASLAFSPAGIAAAALGIALGELGRRQQMAQAAAEQHKQAIEELTQSIMADGGAIGEHTNTLVQQQLAQKHASENATALSVSYGQVTAAAEGSKPALDAFNQNMTNQIKSIMSVTGVFKDNSEGGKIMQQGLLQNADYMNKTGHAADDLASVYGKDLTPAEYQHLLAVYNLQAAVNAQAAATQAAVEAAHQQKAAEEGVSTATLDHYNALVKLNTELLGAVNKDLAYRTALTQLTTAQEAASAAVKQHGANSKEAATAQESEEQAILGVITAAGEKAKALSRATGEDGKAADAARAMNAEAVRLAGTYSGALPQALQEFIGGMDQSSASAAGLTIGVNKAGEAVYQLPNGKEVKIAANVQDAIDGLGKFKTAVDATNAQVKLGVDIDPATKGVLDWKNTTSVTQGNTTTYTNTDPATNAVRVWTVTTNAAGAKTTTYTTTDPATGDVQTWKRNTDGTWALSHTDTDISPAMSGVYRLVAQTNGTWARVPVSAETAPAQGAIDRLINYNSSRSINITTRISNPDGSVSIGTARMNALGNLYTPMASGGMIGASMMALGGNVTPMSNRLAEMVNPNSWRIVGDRNDVKELYAPLDGSARTAHLLSQAAADQGYSLVQMVKQNRAHMAVRASGGGGSVQESSSDDIAGAVAAGIHAAFGAGVGVRLDPNSMERGLMTLAKRRAAR